MLKTPIWKVNPKENPMKITPALSNSTDFLVNHVLMEAFN
jgi:hypothetical protein